MGSPEIWAEYGPLALVIFALFSIVGMFVRYFMKYLADLTTAHTQERADWRSHAEGQMSLNIESHERIAAANRDAMERIGDTTNKSAEETKLVVRELTSAVRELTASERDRHRLVADLIERAKNGPQVT